MKDWAELTCFVLAPRVQIKLMDATQLHPTHPPSSDLGRSTCCMCVCVCRLARKCAYVCLLVQNLIPNLALLLILIDDSVYLWNNNPWVPLTTMSTASLYHCSPQFLSPSHPWYENDIRNKMRFEILCLTSSLMKQFHSWAWSMEILC